MHSLPSCVGTQVSWWSAVPDTNRPPPSCRAVLVESIPEGLDFPEGSTSNPSTSQAWLGLLARAHSSLDVASFYWTLTSNDTHIQEPSAQQVPGNPRPGGKQWGSERH